MGERVVVTDSANGQDLSGATEYLLRHPLVRYACAAAALSASLYAATRSARARGTRKRIAFAAFALITAGQSAAVMWALPAVEPLLTPHERVAA